MPQSSGGGKADMEFLIQRSRAKRTQWYLLGTLVAVELLMSFSFLGYLHIAPISITFAYIPVLLAGVLMGPVESTVLGAVFGTASMWKASAGYVLPADQLFPPLQAAVRWRAFCSVWGPGLYSACWWGSCIWRTDGPVTKESGSA